MRLTPREFFQIVKSYDFLGLTPFIPVKTVVYYTEEGV